MSIHGDGAGDYESDEEGEVFLDEDDIIQEIAIDEEDLPDRDEEVGSDGGMVEEADDSVFVFRGHSDEIYTVSCSPTDASLVATGGKDDRGFFWKIGSVDASLELRVNIHFFFDTTSDQLQANETGLQVEMYVPNHEEHEEDLHVPAELIMKTEVKQVQHAVQALTSRILEEQAMELQSMSCRMINFIQVDPKMG
ncbi:hypothetical protein ZIOFF_062102 [Zingiber officinale]|uniref:Uncharacterized protein n=1 Tax=Zingiber officinale TaxID=94328 RepID=A0A8J5F512_ZINOF|nr:hypothetical protein ZIOFF_062102 [Zingiber officinale]